MRLVVCLAVVLGVVHAVSLGVNPRFGNNPRWLWESVALYQNGEFIVSRYGRAALLRLIETSADGQGVLGIAHPAFEQAWQSFVRQRYL
jgi:hypothetical protein